MPEHLKSLIVILCLSSGVFALARAPACRLAIDHADFTRRRNLWLGITLAAFVAHNFWLFLVVSSVLLLVALQREKNALAMFFFLIFAVPPFQTEIPGMGIINFLMDISYLKLLGLLVLLPTALSLWQRKEDVISGHRAADWYLAGFLILLFVLQLTVDTATNSLRHAVYSFIGAALPYYVASRLPRNLAAFREVLMAFVIAAMLLAAIAVFEFAKQWLLYASLPAALGVHWNLGSYLSRGNFLRSVASTGHAIALGYVMAVAIGLYLFLQRSTPRASWYWGFLLLLAGLVTPLSRGPWVGAAIMFLVFVATGPRPLRDIGLAVMVGLLALPILWMSPWGERMIDFLPFVGTVDADNVTYRQRLVAVSLDVVAEHPWFGASDFLLDPRMQQLVQGEKMIDMVNSYLDVALSSGLVGLSLLLAFFATVAFGILREMKYLTDKDSELYLLGRSLLATLAGILVTISTVGSILAIPVIYWSISGLCIAYARMLASVRMREMAHRPVYTMASSN
ncbi:MAG: O-antigen ligase family protein [Bacteroidota bacterium]